VQLKSFPVVEKAEAFKATVPLVVDESFVQALIIMTSNTKTAVFIMIFFVIN
jgi:hypothetical protein